MAWDHLSITKPHLVYIILGGFTTLFMLCSSFIKERMYIGEATVATLCGVIFGAHAANLIDPQSWGSVDIITLEFSRLVLVVQCFAIGVELPKYYMEKHWKSVAFLLMPVMTFGWLVTSLFVWWLVEPLNFLESLVVAACVTATDPVLASSVVGKGKFAKRVPKHLRDLLSAESGCNDGMAFPFVYLSLYLIHDRQSARDVSFHWIVYTVLYECAFGALFGFVIGYIARHAVKYSERHDLIDRESFLVFYFVLALFCAGSGSILGVDDLLVGFAAGVGFSNDGWFTQKTEESHVSNVIDLLINLAYFVYFGTIIPWDDFNDAVLGLKAWRLALLAIFVILFRRIPIMMALKPLIPDIKTWREALFAGHFGPIGVGAIFIAILARAELETEAPVPLSELPPPTSDHYTAIVLVWPVVSFLVVASILVHGSSIAVFTLGKHINTLTITMSYTQANEDGPGWMNRLPRISSQPRSQANTISDTEGDELKLPEYPPGTLPPVGIPGQLLRRVREEDANSQGSRSSSVAAGRREKWGIGPGGPISQSAIFPQRRDEAVPPSPGILPPGNTERTPQDESLMSPGEPATPGSLHIETAGLSPAELSTQTGAAGEARPALGTRRSHSVEVYGEGSIVVYENEDGDVLAVEPSRSTDRVAEQTGALVSELNSEAGPSSWTYDSLRKRVRKWREAEAEKRKGKERKMVKGEPARAFQFGNTIIVENEDGEVLKQYSLPTHKPQPDLVSHGLKYMGMGIFARAVDKPCGEASTAAAQGTITSAEPSAPAPKERRKRASAKHDNDSDNDNDDDRHIRFTIGGVGKRMTKQDFINEMRKLDKPARKELLDKLPAPDDVKALALDAPPEDNNNNNNNTNAEPPARPGAPNRKHSTRTAPAAATATANPPSGPTSGTKPPSPGTTRNSGAPNREVEPEGSGTVVERGARGVGGASSNERDEREDEQGETAAERRRRDAALGLAPQGEDGDGGDGDVDNARRVPPPRRAAIRFVEVPERGRPRG